MPDVIREGAIDAPVRILLAHGAGAGMDHAFLTELSRLLAGPDIEVVRFNFPYMTKRAQDGKRRPPDRAPVLLAHWRDMIREFAHPRLFLVGKSMGGRIASLIADEVGARGLICLGYPFHPPGRPGQTRIGHLQAIRTPTLIVQGERDPFGDASEVGGYALSGEVRVHWLADGDHGFRPRASAQRSRQENWHEALEAIVRFVGRTRR